MRQSLRGKDPCLVGPDYTSAAAAASPITLPTFSRSRQEVGGNLLSHPPTHPPPYSEILPSVASLVRTGFLEGLLLTYRGRVTYTQTSLLLCFTITSEIAVAFTPSMGCSVADAYNEERTDISCTLTYIQQF